MTSRRRPGLAVLAALVASTVLLTGCGDDEAGVSHDEMAETLADRLELVPEQADCVADRLTETLDADEQRLVVEVGVPALDVGRWPLYVYALVGCLDSSDPSS